MYTSTHTVILTHARQQHYLAIFFLLFLFINFHFLFFLLNVIHFILFCWWVMKSSSCVHFCDFGFGKNYNSLAEKKIAENDAMFVCVLRSSHNIIQQKQLKWKLLDGLMKVTTQRWKRRDNFTKFSIDKCSSFLMCIRLMLMHIIYIRVPHFFLKTYNGYPYDLSTMHMTTRRRWKSVHQKKTSKPFSRFFWEKFPFVNDFAIWTQNLFY